MLPNRSRWNTGALLTASLATASLAATSGALGGCNMLVGLDDVNIVQNGASAATSGSGGSAETTSSNGAGGAGSTTASSGGGGTTTSASGGAGGNACSQDSDCTPPLVCNVLDGSCVAPSCNDGSKNGDETALDCGGPLCPACANGLGCAAASDCQSGFCNGVCLAPSCNDGSKNGDETDVDCGGSCAGKCDDFEDCESGADCQSKICSGAPDKQCAAPACGDGVLNGVETCDDGDAAGGDGCSAACALESGYTCEGSPSQCWTVCGDGITKNNEQCDDGNKVSADGCSSICQVEPFFQCIPEPPGTCEKQEVRCNDGVDNDGDALADGSDGDCGLPIYAPPPGCQVFRIYQAVGLPEAIPDSGAGVAVSRIVVADSFAVAHTSLLLDITHPHVADLDVTLIPPFGTPRNVTSGNGDGADYTSTVFHSSCFEPVTMGSPPFDDCYKPETFLPGSAQPAKGIWSLKIEDHATGDTGTLNGWSLMLCAGQ